MDGWAEALRDAVGCGPGAWSRGEETSSFSVERGGGPAWYLDVAIDGRPGARRRDRWDAGIETPEKGNRGTGTPSPLIHMERVGFLNVLNAAFRIRLWK